MQLLWIGLTACRSAFSIFIISALGRTVKSVLGAFAIYFRLIKCNMCSKVCSQKAKERKNQRSYALSFGAEDGTRTHTPKYWLLRPERLPFRHFRLFHFGPAHSQNSRPTSTCIIPFLALPCQFPGLSPPFGGCLSTGVVLG